MISIVAPAPFEQMMSMASKYGYCVRSAEGGALIPRPSTALSGMAINRRSAIRPCGVAEGRDIAKLRFSGPVDGEDVLLNCDHYPYQARQRE
jgi:hypothetical protein